jgi:hypothetical protein
MKTAWILGRQVRVYVYVLVGLSVALGAGIAWNGNALHHFIYTGIPCHVGIGTTSCNFNGGSEAGAIDAQRAAVFKFLVMAFPAVVGAIIGARFITAESSMGVMPLTWTQSEVRTSWLRLRLIAGSIATLIVLAPLVFALQIWWYHAPTIYQQLSTTDFFFEPVAVPLVGLASCGLAMWLCGYRREWLALPVALLVLVVNLGVVTEVLPAVLRPTISVFHTWSTPYQPGKIHFNLIQPVPGGTTLYQGPMKLGAALPPFPLEGHEAWDTARRCQDAYPWSHAPTFQGTATQVQTKLQNWASVRIEEQYRCYRQHGIEEAAVSLSGAQVDTLQVLDGLFLLVVCVGGVAIAQRRRWLGGRERSSLT